MQAVQHIGLPDVFTPETTDVYDRKNMPRVVFCLHALSLFLYKARMSFAAEGIDGLIKSHKYSSRGAPGPLKVNIDLKGQPRSEKSFF